MLNLKPFLMTDHTIPVAIQAETGSGKTTETLRFVADNPRFFGHTLFVFPTSLACAQHRRHGREHIVCSTPKQAIRCMVHQRFQTIVMDEAHHPSAEYRALFRMIATARRRDQSLRVVFLSATLVSATIREAMQEPVDFFHLDSTRRFKVDIRYRHALVGHVEYINIYSIMEEMATTIQHHLEMDRACILCFLATHDQCHRMYSRIKEAATQSGFEVVVMHGGMEADEMNKARYILSISPRCICFATNIVETAITIKDVNIVIDSGIRCTARQNIVTMSFCDKISMTQRAGRTGRTCNGVVYRLMSEERYNGLEEHEEPYCDFDPIVLQLFNMNCRPLEYIGSYADKSITKMEALGIHRPSSLSRFLEDCGLDMRFGMMIHRLQPDDTMVLLALILINYYHCKPAYWVYYPVKTTREKARILRKIRLDFGYERDLLLTLVRIVLSIFLSSNPKEMAAKYSFNFKTLRDVFQPFKRMATRDWRAGHVVDGKGIVLLPPAMAYHVRSFFWREKTFEQRFGLNFMSCPENAIMIPDNTLVDYKPHARVSLCDEGYRDGVIINLCNDEFVVTLWTQPPCAYRSDGSLHEAIADYRQYVRDKDSVRRRMDAFLHDIKTDVAFRPGMYRIMEEFDQLARIFSTAL